MAIEKVKIMGAVLELPAKQYCQFGPFTKKSGKMCRIDSAVKLVALKPGFSFFQLIVIGAKPLY